MRIRNIRVVAVALLAGLSLTACFRSTPPTVPTPPPNLPSAPNNQMGGAPAGVPRPGMPAGPGAMPMPGGPGAMPGGPAGMPAAPGGVPRPGGNMGGVLGPGLNTNVTGPPSGAKVVGGGSFNKMFPNDQGGYNRVFTQEKKGFAEAILTKGGKKVAVLSISDIAANPAAISKYQSSGKQIAGHPAAPVGSNGSAILIANRYQVQVRTFDPSFTAEDREAWLGKFNLRGLAALK